ncbi:hypothetical protein QJS04_geneDACA005526 [Acorus gramineus]|uniref:CUE domain-containing protein n=1 Tax=Acorus gramineus TaxID=55184 RepID=A0AAV9A4I7_ACOGR|nr:hypothetical protein QJS04_geneDACA005526 [Acorus gramineus]
MSSLNPHAAPFIPMSQKLLGGNHDNLGMTSGVSEYQSSGNLHVSEYTKADIDTEKQIVVEEFMLAVDYLSTMFPDVDVESIIELFYANEGDFESTLEILEHLELRGGESSQHPSEQPDVNQNLNSDSMVGGDGSASNTEVNIVGGPSASSDLSTPVAASD